MDGLFIIKKMFGILLVFYWFIAQLAIDVLVKPLNATIDYVFNKLYKDWW